jgi:hypothetical protein
VKGRLWCEVMAGSEEPGMRCEVAVRGNAHAAHLICGQILVAQP